MSENKRTPEQILEEANAFFERAGVTYALEEFLNSKSVQVVVDEKSKLCEEEIRELVNEQTDELIAKADAAGVCDDEAEWFRIDFPKNFRIFMFLDHIEVLKAYGVEEESIFVMLSNVLGNNSEILHKLVNDVCEIQREKRYRMACESLEMLHSGELEVPGSESVTYETCGETKCLYNEECRELGFCPKGQEFHCNGKGSEECDCPCANSCGAGGGLYPCMELDFMVIPPEGGCCERGVN